MQPHRILAKGSASRVTWIRIFISTVFLYIYITAQTETNFFLHKFYSYRNSCNNISPHLMIFFRQLFFSPYISLLVSYYRDFSFPLTGILSLCLYQFGSVLWSICPYLSGNALTLLTTVQHGTGLSGRGKATTQKIAMFLSRYRSREKSGVLGRYDQKNCRYPGGGRPPCQGACLVMALTWVNNWASLIFNPDQRLQANAVASPRGGSVDRILTRTTGRTEPSTAGDPEFSCTQKNWILGIPGYGIKGILEGRFC